MVGDTYTLVDMAVWGWVDAINARPAAQRAEALKERFAFKQEMDEEARKAMFPQNARLAAA